MPAGVAKQLKIAQGTGKAGCRAQQQTVAAQGRDVRNARHAVRKAK